MVSAELKNGREGTNYWKNVLPVRLISVLKKKAQSAHFFISYCRLMVIFQTRDKQV